MLCQSAISPRPAIRWFKKPTMPAGVATTSRHVAIADLTDRHEAIMAADGTGATAGKIVVSGETVRPAANGETAKTGATVAGGITSRIIVGDLIEALPCRRAFLCPVRNPI